MRIGVNAVFLRPGQVGGAEQMLYSLLKGIAGNLAPGDSMVVLARPAAVAGSSWPAHPQIRVVAAQGDRVHRALAEPRELRKLDVAVDVWLHPNYYTPPGVRLPQVTVVHDAQFRHLPENFSHAKRAWLAWAHRRTLRHAARTVAISQAVARDLALHTPPSRRQRLRVIHNPVDFGRLDAAAGARRQRPAGRRTVLAVAAHYPHKNLHTLVAAYRLLRRRRQDVRLALVGQHSDRLVGTRRAAWDRDAARDLAAAGIDLHGYVDDATIATLYRSADVLACPSLFEGFGLPVAEALGIGLPVVASGIPVLREISCGAAVHVTAPKDPDEWACALAAVLDDPAGHAPTPEQVDRIRRRYDPRRIGRLYLDLLLEAAGDG